MNDLIAKISSYDIFINVIPGAIFIYFLKQAGIFTVEIDSLVGDLVLYYFTGLVISRIGSVLVEPLLRLVGFVKYGSYSDFIKASAKDPKILVLLEASNLYRTVIALMLVCAVAYNWDVLALLGLSSRAWILCGCAALTLLFLISFRKQSGFISKRVEHHKDSQ